MDCYELVSKVGGEIVRGQARVRQDKVYVVLGKLNGDSMEMTEAGRKMAADLPSTDTGRKRKPKTTREDLSSLSDTLSTESATKPSAEG